MKEENRKIKDEENILWVKHNSCTSTTEQEQFKLSKCENNKH